MLQELCVAVCRWRSEVKLLSLKALSKSAGLQWQTQWLSSASTANAHWGRGGKWKYINTYMQGSWQHQSSFFCSTGQTYHPDSENIKRINSICKWGSLLKINLQLLLFWLPQMIICLHLHNNPLYVLLHYIHEPPLTSFFFFLPASSTFIIICPVHSLSLLCTCANHLSLTFLTELIFNPASCLLPMEIWAPSVADINLVCRNV